MSEKRNLYSGIGTPEGVVVANPGDLYLDAAASVIYQKSEGNGSTGWTSTGTADAVHSVNGANGDVVLAAADVGALPDAVEIESASNAIGIAQGTCLITKAGSAAVLTLGAPVAGARSAGHDDGKKLKIIALTAEPHTVTTSANKINVNGATGDVVTFAAVGDAVELVAYGGVWYGVLSGPTPTILSEA